MRKIIRLVDQAIDYMNLRELDGKQDSLNRLLGRRTITGIYYDGHCTGYGLYSPWMSP